MLKTFVSSCLGLFTSAALAVPVLPQSGFDVRDPFIAGLRKLATSAEERTAFASITMPAPSGQTAHQTTVTLPSANSCAITSKAGTSASKPSIAYACSWKHTDPLRASKAYERIEEKILISGDWVARPDRDPRSLKHTSYDASTGAQVHLTLDLSRTNSVRLAIALGKTQLLYADSAPEKQNAPEDKNSNTAKNGPVKQQMSVGILAVLSDRGGNLFVDGEPKLAITPRKITKLELTAGQHFVDLRDDNGSSSKLWEKIVNVPIGAQSVEKIELGVTVPRETTTVQEEQQHSRGRQLSTTSSEPTIDDYPKSVAAAIAQLMAAWNSNFERVKGPQKNETSGIKQYQVNVVVPGFQCTLNEMKQRWHVFCSSNQPADTGERQHLAIARALADQLRPMDYSCQSGPVEPGPIVVDPVSIHSFSFRRSFADPAVTQYLSRYTEDGLHFQPPGSFNISFLVNPPFNSLLKKVVSEPPIECDYSYSALKSQERHAAAGGAQSPITAGQSAGLERSAFLKALSGDWQCDSSSPCQKGRILVSGDPGKLDKFSAALDLDYAPNNGWSCNVSRDGHCSWVLSGIIDGLSLDGIAQEPSLHYKKGCDTPYATHRFIGTISNDGRRIVIHTESNIYNPLGSGWIWSKDIVKCTDVRVDHAEAVMMVLRSERPELSPISVPQQGVGTSSDISAEIDSVVSSGRYSPLQPVQLLAGVSSGSDQVSLSFKNHTSFELRVLLAGPTEKAITIPAGGSQMLVLPAGTYRVLGRVSSPSVLPFFGTQIYAVGNEYEESFHIK